MRPLFAALLLLGPALAFAHAGTHDACITHDPATGEHIHDVSCDQPKGPFSQGRVVLRGGADFDLNQSINLGGSNPNGPAVVGGINVGAGYFLIDNLSLDIDTQSHLQLSPGFAVQDLGLTPGARYQFIPQAFIRAGVPILLVPDFGLGVLGGAGYYQPLGSHAAFVLGADYTYYLTEAYRRTSPLGRVDLHAGVQTWF
ncbi:MAG: hypothetical protein IRZ16_04625 [Myxococcaceae bacterium]|nr:hypothetical protein [Myxococcaceae bacterium]